jgi:hypothetical protein
MKNLLISIIALASIALGGCAVGNKHAYHEAAPMAAPRTDKAVAIASHDQREYVRSGRSQPDLVGMQRGGFGNPFDVRTESGRTLAAEFTAAMRGALERNGIRVIAVDTKATEDEQGIVANLRATKGERQLLLAIREWLTDSMVNTELSYDLRLTVTDDSGKQLATKQLAGKRDLGGSAMNPPAHAKAVAPGAFKDAVESLLNSPEITAGLK